MALIAKMNFAAHRKHGRTCLQQHFATPPFKLAQLPVNSDGVLPLVLMSSSPGVLDGDEYKIEMKLHADAQVQLKTQSYQRLFSMQLGATQQSEIWLGERSVFSFLPHPVVPHRGSRFQSFSNIHMHPTATLLWSEILTPGRQLHNETFTFHTYANTTQIFINQKLVVKENVWLQPALQPINVTGLMENFTHSASLLFISPNVDVAAQKIALLPQLQRVAGMAAGISQLPVNGLCVRLLGHNAEQLFDVIQIVAAQLMQALPQQKMPLYVA